MRKFWFLIQYDIVCERRLVKLFRFLKSEGIWLQNSVFIWQGTRRKFEELKWVISGLIDLVEDDVRGYLLKGEVDVYGVNPLVEDVYFSGVPLKQKDLVG